MLSQIGRLENENKSLTKGLENSGGSQQQQQQLQDMQAMVMKMAASAQNTRPTSGGKQESVCYTAYILISFVEAFVHGSLGGFNGVCSGIRLRSFHARFQKNKHDVCGG